MSHCINGPYGARNIQEFLAHGANVSCLALGHKSGYVLVTGGDDKKVNLWAIGKPNCIMSLSGHTTPIRCVRFGHTENTVCAGSIAGALKVWDLEAARLLRTLTGHKGTIKAIEFHPYGDILTSGSMDTSIKLWDIRRKGCIFAYKGHTDAVTSLKFSPDGQWIASAGDDGYVKMWDLRMGRMLKQFEDHSGPVSAVEFHPHEFLLASASQDHTLNFWDLEHFSLVSQTAREAPASRCLHFSAGGEMLYAGGPETLRVYAWEPARTVSTVHIPWGKVWDIATSPTGDKLIGASFLLTNVSIWMIETDKLIKDDSSPLESSPNKSNPFVHGNSLRKSFTKQKPTPEAKKSLSVKTIEESERSETDPEDETIPEILNVSDYRAVFQPSRSLNRSPPVSIYTCPHPPNLINLPPPSPTFVKPIPVTVADTVRSSPAPQYLPVPTKDTASVQTDLYETELLSQEEKSYTPPPPPQLSSLSIREPAEETTVFSPCGGNINRTRRHSISRGSGDSSGESFPVVLSSIHHSSSESNVATRSLLSSRILSSTSNKTLRSNSQSGISMKPALRETKSDRGLSGGTSGITSRPQSPPSSQPPPRPMDDEFVPMTADRPAGLDLDDFLPKSYQKGLSYTQAIPDLSEAEVLSSMMRGHDSLMAILDSRSKNLQIIFTVWKSHDLKAALEAAVNMNDNSVIVDFLSTIIHRPNIWNLDICVLVLPSLYNLLQSKYETHMRAGCDALRLILRNFTPVIKSTVSAGSSAIGVDISREERYNKCMKCYNSLLSIRGFLLKRQTLQGPLGQSFRELHVSLQQIDAN